MGAWHRIRIDDDEHPKSYPVKVGDLIQCYIPFPVGPHYVRDIAVFVEKEGFREIGVVYTSDPEAIRAGQISAFFFVQSDGPCTIRLTPVVVGKIATEYAINFLAS